MFLAHLSSRLIGEALVYTGIRRPSVNIFKRLLLRSRVADTFHIKYIASTDVVNKKLCFCCGRIITLVAMATYSFHRLIMGKVEIDRFCSFIGNI